MYNALDSDEEGSDKLDESCFIIRSISILGYDWSGEAVLREVMSFDESMIDAVDARSRIC